MTPLAFALLYQRSALGLPSNWESRSIPYSGRHWRPRCDLALSMWFLRALFDSSFRAARKAEGRRAYREAAALYLEADAPADAARALLFHAALTDDVQERLWCYREALQWLEPDSPRFRQVNERFARLLLREGEEGAVPERQRQRWLMEAAERLAALGDGGEAARAYRLLGLTAEARNALMEAGDVESLERLLEAEQQANAQRLKADQLNKNVATWVRYGARSEAVQALEGALDEAWDPKQLDGFRGQLSELQDKIPAARRVRMRIGGQLRVYAGRRSVTVGRGGCDLSLRDPSVSRSHLRVAGTGHGLVLEDMGSRQGVQVQGVPLAARAAFTSPVEVTLSLETTLRVTPNEAQSVVIEVVRGPDAGLRFTSAEGPMLLPGGAVSLRFENGWPTVAPKTASAIILNGQRCTTSVSLLVGDRFYPEGKPEQLGEVVR